MRLKKLLSKGDGRTDPSCLDKTMTRISVPVLENLAAGTLKQNMPFESLGN